MEFSEIGNDIPSFQDTDGVFKPAKKPEKKGGKVVKIKNPKTYDKSGQIKNPPAEPGEIIDEQA